ncbi:MAG: hypothetical protein NXI00_06510 [Cytophagales bacterium]|nr:hypothetical protein [Cytophagales bacterium]
MNIRISRFIDYQTVIFFFSENSQIMVLSINGLGSENLTEPFSVIYTQSFILLPNSP